MEKILPNIEVHTLGDAAEFLRTKAMIDQLKWKLSIDVG